MEEEFDVLLEFERERVDVAEFLVGNLVTLVVPVHAFDHLAQTLVLHSQVAVRDAHGDN